MRKFFNLVLCLSVLALMVTALTGCDNGGGSSPKTTHFTTPAYGATVISLNPVAAFGENGDLIGYVVGTETDQGQVTIYNPEVSKFFIMTMDSGSGRPAWYGSAVRFMDKNCQPYGYGRFRHFVFASHVEFPPLYPGQDDNFATMDTSRPASIDDMVYMVAYTSYDYNNPVEPTWICKDTVYDVDGVTVLEQGNEISPETREYWQGVEAAWPSWKFYPYKEFSNNDLPFQYPVGSLTFDIESQNVEEGK